MQISWSTQLWDAVLDDLDDRKYAFAIVMNFLILPADEPSPTKKRSDSPLKFMKVFAFPIMDISEDGTYFTKRQRANKQTSKHSAATSTGKRTHQHLLATPGCNTQARQLHAAQRPRYKSTRE
jgi:hypothetical protein